MQSFLVILYIPQNTSDNSNHEKYSVLIQVEMPN